MLPEISLNANSGDITKQVSSLRTQLAQLKDAIEGDLNNIGYDNLNADLRKHIDNATNTAVSAQDLATQVIQSLSVNYLSASEITAKYATISELSTNYLKASDITSTYATITSLNAATARIGTIESNYIDANYVSSNYASYGWVQALDAIVGAINADYVTAGQLNAVKIDASQITSGTISADRISSNTFSSYYIKCKGLNVNNTILEPINVKINGVSYYFLGAYGGIA